MPLKRDEADVKTNNSAKHYTSTNSPADSQTKGSTDTGLIVGCTFVVFIFIVVGALLVLNKMGYIKVSCSFKTQTSTSTEDKQVKKRKEIPHSPNYFILEKIGFYASTSKADESVNAPEGDQDLYQEINAGEDNVRDSNEEPDNAEPLRAVPNEYDSFSNIQAELYDHINLRSQLGIANKNCPYDSVTITHKPTNTDTPDATDSDMYACL